MPPNSPEQASQGYRPLEWGENLAEVDVHYLGVHNDYLELGAIRPDGTVRMFGELTSSGFDGSRSGFGVPPEDKIAAPGRALVSLAVQSVMELERLEEPQFKGMAPKPPVGDWEPEPEADLNDLSKGLSAKRSIGRKLDELQQSGGLEKLNEVLGVDDKLSVGLIDEHKKWSIVRLVGFEEYKPETELVEVGFRPVVMDRTKKIGLRPVNARISKAFIRRD